MNPGCSCSRVPNPCCSRSPSTPCSAIREALNRRQLHPVQLIGRVIAWADARFNRESDTPRSPAQFRRLDHDRAAGGRADPGPSGPDAAARPAARLAVAGDRDVHPDRAEEPLRPCRGGRLGPGDRRPRRRPAGGVAHRRPRSGSPGPGRRRRAPRSNRWPRTISDGVVAPVFWAALFGLPGLLAYKVDQHRRQHDRPQERRATCISAGRRRGWTICSTSSRRGFPESWSAPRRGSCPAPIRSARGAQCGAMPSITARPMPAGPKRRSPARSASRSPARGSITASWSRITG